MGFLEPFDFTSALALTKIDYLDSSVSECGDEDALSLEVGGKMIDAALDAGEGDFALQAQGWRLRKGESAAKCGRDYQE